MSFEEVKHLTLREFIVIWDSYRLTSWDHTALNAALLHNLMALTHNINAKKRLPFKSMFAMHPFRKDDATSSSVHKITRKTFGALKAIGRALVRK
jgi:hypothetical protein